MKSSIFHARRAPFVVCLPRQLSGCSCPEADRSLSDNALEAQDAEDSQLINFERPKGISLGTRNAGDLRFSVGIHLDYSYPSI